MQLQGEREHHFLKNSLVILVLAIPVEVRLLIDNPLLVLPRIPGVDPDAVLGPVLRVDVEVDAFYVLDTPDLLLVRDQLLSPSELPSSESVHQDFLLSPPQREQLSS